MGSYYICSLCGDSASAPPCPCLYDEFEAKKKDGSAYPPGLKEKGKKKFTYEQYYNIRCYEDRVNHFFMSEEDARYYLKDIIDRCNEEGLWSKEAIAKRKKNFKLY